MNDLTLSQPGGPCSAALCWPPGRPIKGQEEQASWILRLPESSQFCAPEKQACDIPAPSYNGQGNALFLSISQAELSRLPCEKGRQVGGLGDSFEVPELTFELDLV